MVELSFTQNFSGLTRFQQNIKDALTVGVQDAAVETELLALEEVALLDAYDTFALMESIYVSLYGYSNYDEKTDMAADALLNNPTKWPLIRQIRLAEGADPFLELDPQVTSDSRYDAWVAVAASHGKYVENGYVSWFGNWVPARPFWQATIERARPAILAILHKAVLDCMWGKTSGPPPSSQP